MSVESVSSKEHSLDINVGLEECYYDYVEIILSSCSLIVILCMVCISMVIKQANKKNN